MRVEKNLCEHEMKIAMILLKERKENSKIEKENFKKADFNKLRILEDHVMEEKFKGMKELSTSF